MPPPPKVIALTERARNGLRSLERKMVPPPIALLDFVSDFWSSQIAYAVAELELMDALAAGPRSASDIARELELNEDHLYRLLRAASNLDLVREEPGRTFSLRPLGEALCKNEGESLREFILLMGKLGTRFWPRLADAVRQGKSAVEIETGKKPFEFLLGDDNARHVFNRAMTAISARSAEAMLAAYDVSGFAKIVDVGGGQGRLLSALLSQAPSAKGVLFDLPAVVEDAPQLLDQLGTRARVEIVGGDFFAEVPAGGDLYVMKSIIHDWQDPEASQILANIRRAIAERGKLVLYETVVPGANQKHLSKFLDIEMIVHAGGRERTHEEFRALLSSSGFALNRVLPTAGPMCLVEATPS